MRFWPLAGLRVKIVRKCSDAVRRVEVKCGPSSNFTICQLTELTVSRAIGIMSVGEQHQQGPRIDRMAAVTERQRSWRGTKVNLGIIRQNWCPSDRPGQLMGPLIHRQGGCRVQDGE